MPVRFRSAPRLAPILAWLFIAACSSGRRAPPPTAEPEPEETAPEVECPKGKDTMVCVGNWAATCDKDGRLDELVNCRLSDQVCAEGQGCRACVPGKKSCGAHNDLTKCRADGSGYDRVEVCDASAGQKCSLSLGVCADLCKEAADSHSYIGCEYWAVPTINSQLGSELNNPVQTVHFTFAVVIANPQAESAEIEVERGGSMVSRRTVKPGKVEAIELDWIPELTGKQPTRLDKSPIQHSSKVRQGAYRISSNVPVTAYQFNPLEYKEGSGQEVIYSHSNDASLLLPTHALTGNYLVISRPALVLSSSMQLSSHCGGDAGPPCEQEDLTSLPGFVAIIGVEDAAVSVETASSAYTAAGPEIAVTAADAGVDAAAADAGMDAAAADAGMDAAADAGVDAAADTGAPEQSIPALKPGEKYSTTLEKGEVLQLVSSAPDKCASVRPADKADWCYKDPATGDEVCASAQYKYCKVGAEYDLTGTAIKASGKVAVIAGHDCDFVPYYRWACDHLEETMFPLQAWGKELFVSVTQPVREEPNIIRILSGSDGNRLSFTPEVRSGASLDKGKFIEFTTDRHFQVKASGPIAVAQFLVGQDYKGFGDVVPGSKGDPSLTLGIPREQWRTSYSFLAPLTFPENWVNVVAETGQVIVLDDEWVGEWTEIKGTGMSVARVLIEGGPHKIESRSPFGIEVYGYASYTSYMYPGGLDLRLINPLL